jgi:uncharacterized membrane protein YkvA (DUF1232 family)
MPARGLGQRLSRSSFFTRLKNKAVEYLKDSERLKRLVDNATRKSASLRGGPLRDVLEPLKALFRLLRAYVKGEYTETPWQSLILIVATVLYFLIPLDLLPDIVLGLGYVDDAALIVWTINAIKSDLDAFLRWESSPDSREPV